jgi:hypothetical protein
MQLVGDSHAAGACQNGIVGDREDQQDVESRRFRCPPDTSPRDREAVQPATDLPAASVEATTGIEPVYRVLQTLA